MSDLIKLTRDIIEEKNLGSGVKIRIYELKTGTNIIAEVSYLAGRFVIEKSYQNTLSGKAELKKFIERFKTAEDVFDYLNIKKGDINMSLENLIKEIERNKKYAEEKIEGGNPATLNMRLGRKRAAQSRLEELFTQYRLDVREHLAFIVPIGSGAMDFVKMSEKSGVTVVSADSFYHDLADRIPSVLYNGKQTMASLIDVFGRHLEDKAFEIGVRSYPAVIYGSKYSRKVTNKKELLTLIKRIINEDVGPEMVGAQILNEVAKIAMANNFHSGIMPVVVSLEDQDIVNSILEGLKTVSNSVCTVGVGSVARGLKSSTLVTIDEVDSESFAKAMKSIKSKLDSNKKRKKEK